MCVCVCVCYAPPSIPPTLLPHYRLAGTSIYVTPRHGSPTQRELCWCSPALSWYSAEQALHFPRTVPAPQEEYLIYYWIEPPVYYIGTMGEIHLPTGWSLVTTATRAVEVGGFPGIVTSRLTNPFRRRCRLTNLYTPGFGSGPLVYRSATAWRPQNANFLACSAVK